MEIAGFDFRPGLWPSLATALALALTLSLGFWQLDRARQKTVLQQTFAQRTALAPVALSRLDPADPETRYRQVTTRGRYDTRHQILLDNQLRQGRPGFHVLTPLRLPGREAALLVNRGWVAADPSRRRLPDIDLPALGPQRIQGRLGQPANPGLRLGRAEARGWPRIVPYVDYQALSRALGYPLLPALLLLDPDQPHGYQRHWRPDFGGLGPQRHRGYAVQWFALSLALVVLYIVVNTRPRRGGR